MLQEHPRNTRNQTNCAQARSRFKGKLTETHIFSSTAIITIFFQGKLQECLQDKGIRLPNTCITIKKDNRAPSKPEQQKVIPVKEATVSSEVIKVKPQQPKKRKESQSTPAKNGKTIHPSIIDIYRRHPKFKLPKKCIARHMAPIVSLAMEEVETYFRKHKLDMTKYIYHSNICIIKKKTSLPAKTVSPLKIRKSFQNHEDRDNYVCSALPQTNDKIAVLKRLPLNTPKSHQDSEKKKDTPINQKCLPSPVQSETETGRRKISNHENNSSRIAQKKDTEPLKEKLITSPTSSAAPQESSETNKQNLTPSKEATNKHDETKTHEQPTLIQQPIEDLSSNQDTTEFDRLSIPSFENSAMSTSITTGNNDKTFKRKTLTATTINSKTRKTFETNMGSHSPDNLHLTSADDCVIVDSATSINVAATSESTEESSSLPNATKPEFIQSLGLTPAVASSQSSHSLECQICSSVQNNMAALKKHSSRHRVCPYCKQKFRTVETKQNHVDRNCEVKNIIESPGTFVSLEKAEFNLNLLKRYKSTFSAFGIEDVKINDVIVLSDDEELQLNQTNQTQPEIDVPLPQEPDDVIDLESTYTPVVSIHNNTILDEIGDNVFDIRLIVALLRVLKKPPRTADQAIQTVQQRPQDLTINKNDTCRLNNIKGHLLSYMVPVTLTCGDFQVSYQPTKEPNKKSNLTRWTDLPVVEKQTPNTSKEVSVVNATYPLTFVTSQVQSSQLSLSSIQLMTATPTMSIFLPNTSAFIPSTGLSIQPSTVAQTQTINNTFFSPISNTSIQTPLLQNYTLSMTPLPIINNQVSMQTTNINANKETSPKSSDAPTEATTSSTSVVASNPNESSSRKSLSSAAKPKKSAALRRSLPASAKSISKTKSKRQLIKVKIGNLASSKSSKLRVKNIWELK